MTWYYKRISCWQDCTEMGSRLLVASSHLMSFEECRRDNFSSANSSSFFRKVVIKMMLYISLLHWRTDLKLFPCRTDCRILKSGEAVILTHISNCNLPTSSSTSTHSIPKDGHWPRNQLHTERESQGHLWLYIQGLPVWTSCVGLHAIFYSPAASDIWRGHCSPKCHLWRSALLYKLTVFGYLLEPGVLSWPSKNIEKLQTHRLAKLPSSTHAHSAHV